MGRPQTGRTPARRRSRRTGPGRTAATGGPRGPRQRQAEEPQAEDGQPGRAHDPAGRDERLGQRRQDGQERQRRRRIEEWVGGLVDRGLGDERGQVDGAPGAEVLAGPQVDPEVAQELAVELDEIGQERCRGGGRRKGVDRLPAPAERPQDEDGDDAQGRPHGAERGPVLAWQPPVVDGHEDVPDERDDGEPAEERAPSRAASPEAGPHSPRNRGGRFSTNAAIPSA